MVFLKYWVSSNFIHNKEKLGSVFMFWFLSVLVFYFLSVLLIDDINNYQLKAQLYS